MREGRRVVGHIRNLRLTGAKGKTLKKEKLELQMNCDLKSSF